MNKYRFNLYTKIAIAVFTVALIVLCTVGCSEADKVSSNLSLEADNFNVVRQVTIMNCIQGDVLFQMTGKMSIHSDNEDHQLEIVVEKTMEHMQNILLG